MPMRWYLQPGGDAVLMAHPLSAVETDYRVIVDGVALYANCAWDSLGIPAMLGRDADIEARHPLSWRQLALCDQVRTPANCEGESHCAFRPPF